MRFNFLVLLNAAVVTAKLSGQSVWVQGYISSPSKPRTEGDIWPCFNGLGLDAEGCKVCGWGSGETDMMGNRPVKMLPESMTMTSANPPALVLDGKLVREWRNDGRAITKNENDFRNTGEGEEGKDMDWPRSCDDACQEQECTDLADKNSCMGRTVEIDGYPEDDKRSFEVCDSFDANSGEPLYHPTERPQPSNMACAHACTTLCKVTGGCDASSFNPKRLYLLEDGSNAYYSAFCALYDLDDYLGGAGDGVESQLKCDAFEDYGGAYPFVDDVFYEGTDLSGTDLGGGDIGGWCIECCDNRRLQWAFEHTVALHCELTSAPDGGLGALLGSDYSKDSDAMNKLEFHFLRKRTVDDRLQTICVLSRFSQYMIGYNLTIGVAEHSEGSDFWIGVEWCIVEPIEATEEFWQTLLKQEKFKMIELVTLRNSPDPFNGAPQGPAVGLLVTAIATCNVLLLLLYPVG